MGFPSQPGSTNMSLVPPPSPITTPHTYPAYLQLIRCLWLADREGARSDTTFSKDCAAIRFNCRSFYHVLDRVHKEDGPRRGSIVFSHTTKLKTQETDLSSAAEIRFNTAPSGATPSCLQTSLSKLGDLLT